MAGNLVNNSSSVTGNAVPPDTAQRYLDYKIDTKYDRDEGLLVMPVAGPAGSAPKVIRVHQPIGYATRMFTASKNGAPPIVPAPINTSSGDIILTSEYEVFLPQASPNQNTWIFRADGVYTYVQGSIRGSGGLVASNNYESGDYPFDYELIDLGARGIIGGVFGAANSGNRLSPNYVQYSTEYPAFFFSTEIADS